jgi:nucleotide-binding universal stress UspA family protein
VNDKCEVICRTGRLQSEDFAEDLSAESSGASVDDQKRIQAASKDLDHLAVYITRGCNASPLMFVETEKPAAMIVEAAKNWPADLIVMGTHGRNVVCKILLGSIAQGVLRKAPVRS